MADDFNLADAIRPAPGKIAVRVEVKEEITPSGLFIPEHTAASIHQERPTQGVVVAVPDDEDDLESAPSRYKVGDVVIFGKYTGTKISYRPKPDADGRRPDPQAIVIMEERAILAQLIVTLAPGQLKVKT